MADAPLFLRWCLVLVVVVGLSSLRVATGKRGRGTNKKKSKGSLACRPKGKIKTARKYIRPMRDQRPEAKAFPLSSCGPVVVPHKKKSKNRQKEKGGQPNETGVAAADTRKCN